MEDTHIDAYLLFLRKSQQQYPKSYDQKINLMCPYFYTQFLTTYTELYQPNRDEVNPLPFFPFNDVKWLEGLIEMYASGDGIAVCRGMKWTTSGDCGAFTLRVIEYILSARQ
ncbi:hypothetical protein ACOSP7_014293 [Xanthoceras sorbifolium]